jgi:hypothetical protein
MASEAEYKHYAALFVIVVAGVLAAGFVAAYINQATPGASTPTTSGS